MVKSMTGFGRGEYNDGKRNIVVEIRSVNNRYADITVKMPRRYSFAQDKVKNLVKDEAKRGKVEVSVMVENITDSDASISLNLPVAKQYSKSLQELKETFGLEDEITLSMLASMPDVIKVQPDIDDEEEMTTSILNSVNEAVLNLEKMKNIEGEKLAEDLMMRADIIKELRDKIDKRAELVPAAYTEKMRERISELIGNSVEIPEERILVEAAIFADKCNITEELIRLESHVIQLKKILKDSKDPVGKKLDFLVQEMNREANTIGSKANDIEITNTVIELKAEIEKVREQVQNIE